MAIAATEMLQAGKLNNNTLIATTMSNKGLEDALAKFGGKVFRTDVGDRYVVEQMRNGGYNLGGEQSGHIIYLDHSTTGDGMVAALKLLATMVRTGKKVSELSQVLEAMPQATVNVKVKTKPPLESLEIVQLGIQAAKDKLGSKGRVLVRYSGTEDKVRILVESPNDELNRRIASALSYEVHKVIGTSFADNYIGGWPDSEAGWVGKK